MVMRAGRKITAAAAFAAVLLALCPALQAQTFRALGRLEAPGYSYFASSAQAHGEVSVTTTSPTGYIIRLSSASGLPAQDVFRVNNGGLLAIGPRAPEARLHVSSAAGTAGDMLVITTGTTNMIRMTGAGEIYAKVFHGFGGFLSDIPSFDELGNHTATQRLNMNGKALRNVSNLNALIAPALPYSLSISTSASARQLYVASNGRTAIGPQTPDDVFHLLGQLRIDNNVNTVNKGCFRYSGTNLQYANDCVTFTDIVQTSDNGWTDAGASVRLTTLTDRVGVGSDAHTHNLYVNGSMLVTTTMSVTGNTGADPNFQVAGATLTVSTGGFVGFGTADPMTNADIFSPSAPLLTELTQGLSKAGLLMETEYTAGTYTPGFFWYTPNNNPTRPKAGVFLLQNDNTTTLYFGTSNAYATGVTNNGLIMDQDGNLGILNTSPGQRVAVTGNIRFSNGLLSANGTPASAPISFSNDPNTGIYRIAEDQLGVTAGGTQRFRIDNSSVTALVPWRGANGTAALPAFTFASNPNTGIYWIGAGQLGMSAAGTLDTTVSDTQVIFTSQFRGQDGTAAAPAVSFTGSTDTGLYKPVNGVQGFSAGAAEKFRVVKSSVGIFTASPEQPLDVGGTAQLARLADATALATIKNSGNLTLQGQYKIGTTANTTVYYNFRNRVSAVTPVYHLAVDANGGAELFSVGNFRVGIGTGVPQATLDVEGAEIACDALESPDGTAANVTYGFSDDTNTGVYRSGADTINFVAGGTNSMVINTSSVTFYDEVLAPAGAVATPAYSFEADPNTGVYWTAADDIKFAAGGVLRLTLTGNSQFLAAEPLEAVPDGTQAVPAFSFSGEPNTGLYRQPDGTLGAAIAGETPLTVGPSVIDSTVTWMLPPGTAAAPAIAFTNNPNTGFLRPLPKMIGVSGGGTTRFTVDQGISSATLPLRGANGTAAAPAFSFLNDPDTGMYRQGTNAFSFATGGAERVRIDASGNCGFGLNGLAPEQRLDVGGGALQVRRISDATSGATMKNSNLLLLQGAYYVGTSGPSTNMAMRLQNVVTAVTPQYKLSIQDNAGVERFLVRNDGHVGISSATPMHALVVTGEFKASGEYLASLGSPAAPAYTFTSDPNTGVYSPGAEQLGFAANGTPSLWLDTAYISRLGEWVGAVGAVATPGYSFAGDPNTGIYHAAADTLNFATGGILRLTLTGASQFLSTLPLSVAPYGTAAAPSFSFTGQTNTGIYRHAANTLGISVGGTAPLIISDSLITSAHTWMLPNGTAANPALSFSNNDNTGFLRPFAKTIGVSGGGTTRFTVDVGASSGTLPLRGANGSAAAPSFSFLGDTDTGIYRQGTNAMSFATGGIERVRVDASGNFGFGLAGAAPGARVDVGGGHLQVRRTANALSGATLKNSNMLMLQGAYYAALVSNAAGMRVVNVMNTTGPQYKLSVQNNTGVEQFMVRSDGKVGISSAAPFEIMGITGNAEASGVYYASLGAASAPAYSFVSDTNTGFYSPGAEQVAFAANGTNALWVDASYISRLGEWVGPVGALATPTYAFAGSPDTGIYHAAADTLNLAAGGVLRLTLTGGSQFLSTLPLELPDGIPAAPAYSFVNDTNTGLFVPSGATGRFSAATNGVERLRITTTGVGIGAITPAYDLELGANSAAKPTSANWTIASDSRLKKDIAPIQNALGKLTSLKGVTYRWKDPASQGNMAGTYMGLIAQDAEKVFPEWVSTNARGYKDLNTIGFHGLVPEALRELKKKNTVLREKLEAQKARLERLKARIR